MIGKLKARVTGRYNRLIREKAIQRARKRILDSGSRPSDFSEDELEVIVHEEEEKIHKLIRGSGIAAIMLALGIA